jgi:tetratricopeptide (TPR) repeat protein
VVFMRISCGISAILVFSCHLSVGFAQDNRAAIETHIQKARDAISRHDLRAASEEYLEVLKLDPGNVEISAARGIALYALGEPAQAIYPLKSALAADPTRGDAETFLGLSLADLGQCREALPSLKQRFAKDLDPKVRRLVGLSLLGCSVNSSNSDDAVDTARQLKKLYPDDPDVLYHVAELYSVLSKETVNDLFKKHPDSFRVHELAGEALEAQNSDRQALIEYRKAVELNPKAPHLHYRIATILLREKKDRSDAEALEQFKQEIAVNSGDAPSEYQIAEILRRQNQLDAASAHFMRALELNPVFVEARLGLAKIDLSRHQVDEAIQQLKAAIQLAPEDPAPHYSLMLAYREIGRAEDAQREMAIVGDLNAKKRTDFNVSLHTLLTGQREQQ